MSFATSPHGDGGEVQETASDINEKVDGINETLGNRSQYESIAIVKTIQRTCFNRPLCVLFDFGSNKSHIHQRVLPKDVNSKTVIQNSSILHSTKIKMFVTTSV